MSSVKYSYVYKLCILNGFRSIKNNFSGTPELENRVKKSSYGL